MQTAKIPSAMFFNHFSAELSTSKYPLPFRLILVHSMSDLTFHNPDISCYPSGILYHILDTLQKYYSFLFMPVISHRLIGLIDFTVFSCFYLRQVPKAICILQALPALFLPFAYGHKKRGTFFLIVM